MRCKACNEILEDFELIDNPETGQPEDLCQNCKTIAFDSLLEIEEEDDLSMQIEELKVIAEHMKDE